MADKEAGKDTLSGNTPSPLQRKMQDFEVEQGPTGAFFEEDSTLNMTNPV